MIHIRPAGALTACLLALPAFAAPHPDHHEFEAAIHAQYRGASGTPREVLVQFSFPDAEALLVAAWRVEVVDGRGALLRTMYGETALQRGAGRQTLTWDGKTGAGAPASEGFYALRLTARAVPLAEVLARSGLPTPARVEQFLAAGGEQVEESADLRVGTPPSPRLLPFRALPAGSPSTAATPGRRGSSALTAAGSLPYSIYLGNLHSQTNHSDGGGAVAICTSAETPWAGQFGPSDAWEMMRTQAGGDILLTSEHNHMYDGSTSTNGAADPAHAHDLFNGGLQAASDYSAAHPGFLALYGTEWGVISGGGHLNVLNPDGLATWESSTSGVLFGDVFVPKSDYAAMYSTMAARGWVGQFNHPSSTSAAFAINGVWLAYDPNGDQVMALCEVTNTSAFSHNTTETETFRTSYEAAFQKLLEAGYHVAPSSDQDNHCANWGLSYPNRTGVLIPQGTPLTRDSFLAAVRARHVFATLDKRSQIILTTGSGALMGDRISSGGPVTLNVLWATTGPHTVSRVQIFEGVPGRNGAVTQLSDGLTSVTLTPSAGGHFYYALITEENGDKLWSAPIWIDQAAGAVSAAIVAPASDQTVANNSTVAFTGSAATANAAIVATSWDFGDGATAQGASVTHLFVNPGSGPVTRLVTFTATDDQGAVGSASRSVTVQPDASLNTPPTISAIAAQTLLKNTAATVSFTVGDAQTSASLLDVSAASSDNVLFPAANLAAGGSGAARTLTLTPAPNRTGSATLTVTVADGGGQTASTSFVATVLAGQPQLIISQYYEGTSNNKWIEITNVGTVPYVSGLYLGTWFNPGTGGTTYGVVSIPALAAGASTTFKNSLAVVPGATNITGSPTVVSGGAMNFNGDDITYITTVNASNATAYNARVDSIGANLTTWTASGGGTTTGGMDRSYVRGRTVVTPTADYVPAQWTKLALATVDTSLAGATERLGEHVFNHAPTITDLADVAVFAGEVAGPYAFTVGDAETAPAALAVTATSSNETLLPSRSITLAGAGASRTLTATPVADQAGTTVVTLAVSDADGRASSTSFQLTVNPAAVTGVSVTPAAAYLHLGAQQQFTAVVTGHGSISTAVLWSASGGAIDASGLYTPPLSGGPYTIVAASAQDPSFSASALVTTNRAPSATGASVETDEDHAVAILLQAADPDADPLTFTISAPPAHGSLSGTGALRTYTPDADYNGADAFTFSATDGLSDPVTAQVLLTVHPVNDAPVAHAAQVNTDEDVPVAVHLVATDVDGDALSLHVVSPPAHGALSGAGADLVYTPAPDWNGADSFTFTADDGQLTSAAATVTLVVAPVNDAPVAQGQAVRTLEDTPVSIGLLASDVDGDPLAFVIVAPPAHGQLSGAGASRTYTPDPDWNGTDQFSFAAFDGQLASQPRTVDITVDPVDDTPVAAGQQLTTPEDTPLDLQLTATDVEGDALSFTVVAPPQHGKLLGAPPLLTYLPDANWNGTDAFGFVANDGQLDSAVATITVVVAPVNDAPLASDQRLATPEDTALPIHLQATDVDGDALSYRIVTPPQHGTLSGTPPLVTYLPDANWNGTDSFRFVAGDGKLDSAAGTVQIVVAAVNDAPVAAGQTVRTHVGWPILIRLTGTDVEGDALTFRIVSRPAHGFLVGTGGYALYLPGPGFAGTDAFLFVANDGTLDSTPAQVSIMVLRGKPEGRRD